MSKTIEFGSYNGNTITWFRIGKMGRFDMYLCDEVFGRTVFCDTPDYVNRLGI